MRGGIAVLVGLLGLALAAQAVPLCDYRSPLTDLSNLVMSFSYEYVNDPYGAKERDVNAGRFVVDYKRLYDTAEYGFDVGVANQLDISLLDVSSYSTVADGNYKRYLTSDGDAFAFAGASVRSSSSYSSLGVSVDLGLGLGRFNDVTPLAIATRIDEDLVRRGRLTDHLRAADLLGVAPGRCVAIEDSPHGVQAALRAGMACLGLATRYATAEQLGATRTVRSLAAVGIP